MLAKSKRVLRLGGLMPVGIHWRKPGCSVYRDKMCPSELGGRPRKCLADLNEPAKKIGSRSLVPVFGGVGGRGCDHLKRRGHG